MAIDIKSLYQKIYIYYQYQKKEKKFLDFQIFFHQDFHTIDEK